MTETVRPAGFSPVEAARQLSISRSYLYLLIQKGLIRSVHIGARRVISAVEIDRVLREGISERDESR